MSLNDWRDLFGLSDRYGFVIACGRTVLFRNLF